MIGDYILHFPLTDFAVSLLALAALVDVGALVLGRPQWAVAVDWLLFAGFAGAVAAVGSGLWLVAAQNHPHDDLLTLHHYFAYGTLGAATVAVAARILQRRVPKLSWLRTSALAIAALLVSCAGFVGGKMSHGQSGGHSHDDMVHDTGTTQPPASTDRAPDEGSAADTPQGSAAPPPTNEPASGSATRPAKPHHDDHPHSH